MVESRRWSRGINLTLKTCQWPIQDFPNESHHRTGIWGGGIPLVCYTGSAPVGTIFFNSEVVFTRRNKHWKLLGSITCSDDIMGSLQKHNMATRDSMLGSDINLLISVQLSDFNNIPQLQLLRPSFYDPYTCI